MRQAVDALYKVMSDNGYLIIDFEVILFEDQWTWGLRWSIARIEALNVYEISHFDNGVHNSNLAKRNKKIICLRKRKLCQISTTTWKPPDNALRMLSSSPWEIRAKEKNKQKLPVATPVIAEVCLIQSQAPISSK